MAIVIGNKQSNLGTNNGDFDINMPTGMTASSGDVIMLIVHNTSTSSIPVWSQTNAPTGFTFAFSAHGTTMDNQVAVFWKLYVGNEGSTITVHDGLLSMGYAIAVHGAQYDAAIGNIGTLAQTADGSTSFSVTGIAGDTGDLQFIVGGGDGGDMEPWGVDQYTETEYNNGSGSYISGFHGPRTSSPTSPAARNTNVQGSVVDGAGARIFRIAIAVTTIPTLIRETLHDVNGDVYADGTTVWCFSATGVLEWIGTVGTITGQNSSYPTAPTAGTGEIGFTWAFGDTAQRFLVVDPAEDVYGLITNKITPVQET